MISWRKVEPQRGIFKSLLIYAERKIFPQILKKQKVLCSYHKNMCIKIDRFFFYLLCNIYCVYLSTYCKFDTVMLIWSAYVTKASDVAPRRPVFVCNFCCCVFGSCIFIWLWFWFFFSVFWSALGSLQRRVSVVCSGTSAEAHPPVVPSVPPVHLLPVSVHRSLI